MAFGVDIHGLHHLMIHVEFLRLGLIDRENSSEEGNTSIYVLQLGLRLKDGCTLHMISPEKSGLLRLEPAD